MWDRFSLVPSRKLIIRLKIRVIRSITFKLYHSCALINKDYKTKVLFMSTVLLRMPYAARCQRVSCTCSISGLVQFSVNFSESTDILNDQLTSFYFLSNYDPDSISRMTKSQRRSIDESDNDNPCFLVFPSTVFSPYTPISECSIQIQIMPFAINHNKSKKTKENLVVY